MPPARALVGATDVMLQTARRGQAAQDIRVGHAQVRIQDHPEPEPHIVSGSPVAVAEKLLGFAALGFTAVNFLPVGPDTGEQLERLGQEVLPAVRAA